MVKKILVQVVLQQDNQIELEQHLNAYAMIHTIIVMNFHKNVWNVILLVKHVMELKKQIV